MRPIRFRLKRGFRAATELLLLGIITASCNYGLTGGGGFPSDIRRLYIESFGNETVHVDLDQQLFQRLSDRLPRALGVQPGSEANADAVVRGRITRYEDVAQSYRPGQAGTVDVLKHQVMITVAVQIIHVRRNVILWESQALTGRGEYNIQNERDTDAWDDALNHILQQIIDGAQSQW